MEKQVERTSEDLHRVSYPFDTDAIHTILADADRRLLLEVLGSENAPLGLSSLAGAIAARPTGTSDEEHLRISLYHNHVPRMEAAGLVEYEGGGDQVELTGRGAVLASELPD